MTRAEYEKKYGVKAPEKNQTGFLAEAFSDVKETGSAIKNTATDTFRKQGDALSASIEGKQSLGAGLGQAFGIGAGGLSKMGGDAVLGVGKTLLTQGGEEKVKGAVGTVAKPIMESKTVQSVIEKYNSLDEKTKRDVDALIGVGSLVADFGGGKILTKGLSNVANKTASIVDDISRKVPRIASDGNLINKATEILSKDIDGKVEVILKETPTEKLDEYIRYGEEAAKDPRALTPFDRVGDRMEEATKLLLAEKKRVGAAKSEFTTPLRQGFDSFSGKSLVDNLTTLSNRLPDKDRAFIKPFIEKAKGVKTKYAADQLIDEIQDAVRTAGAQNLVPRGSALQRQLSGVIEKFNQELKDSLPKEYSVLNTRYSNLKKITDALNRALGEVVDGQSTRGGSLVKQFFSPSGKRAKVLFDYIKENTGIDLAQETTLARFAMELFDDPRSRSLLEGIPKSTTGLIDKTIDFAVEKTGVGKGVQRALREAEVRKAKKLTQ